MLLQLGEGSDSVLQLPSGRVPLFLGDAGVFPVAKAWTGEGFFWKIGGGTRILGRDGLIGLVPVVGEAVQQERVRHEMRVLRGRRVHGGWVACQMNASGEKGGYLNWLEACAGVSGW